MRIRLETFVALQAYGAVKKPLPGWSSSPAKSFMKLYFSETVVSGENQSCYETATLIVAVATSDTVLALPAPSSSEVTDTVTVA